jgi:hypothetical protein
VLWGTPVIPAFERLRQEDPELETNLHYIEKPGLKQTYDKSNESLRAEGVTQQ